MLSKPRFSNTTGFTLIELLVAIALVAVLAAIAIPSYQDTIRKSRRAEAKALLLEVAQLQERHFTEFGQYAITFNDGDVDEDNLNIDVNSENDHYAIDVDNYNGTETTFILTAVPKGGQIKDACENFTLSQSGEKKSKSDPDDRCW